MGSKDITLVCVRCFVKEGETRLFDVYRFAVMTIMTIFGDGSKDCQTVCLGCGVLIRVVMSVC